MRGCRHHHRSGPGSPAGLVKCLTVVVNGRGPEPVAQGLELRSPEPDEVSAQQNPRFLLARSPRLGHGAGGWRTGHCWSGPVGA